MNILARDGFGWTNKIIGEAITPNPINDMRRRYDAEDYELEQDPKPGFPHTIPRMFRSAIEFFGYFYAAIICSRSDKNENS